MRTNRKRRIGKSAIYVMALAMFVMVGAAFAAPGDTYLGQAGDYSEFIFTDGIRTDSDADSAVAYGRDATLTNFSNNDDVSGNGIIVGDDYDHNGGSAEGNVYVGDSVGNTVTINNGTLINGTLIDFSAARNYYKNYSDAWEAAQPAQAVSGCPLELTASNLQIGIFTVSAADLQSCGEVELDTQSNYTGVIINVTGTSVDMTDLSINRNGSSPEAILWNLADATTLNIEDTTIYGNILAPRADVTAKDAELQGTIIAESLDGDNFDTGFAPFIPKYSSDFGDLPSAYNSTLIEDGAAMHILGDSYLGSSVDKELDGQESGNAQGDDNNGDDENGVTADISTWSEIDGGKVTVEVTGSGCLHGWVDWNQDGDFDDAGEKIISSQAVSSGSSMFTFAIPAGALTGNALARYRLTDQNADGSCSSIGVNGIVVGGEVEDYMYTFNGQTAVSISGVDASSAASIAPVLLVALTLLGSATIIVRKES